MNRSSKEITDEILHRALLLDNREAKRKNHVYSALSLVACIAFVVGLSVCVPLLVSDEVLQVAAGYQTATLFASGAVGGYVLVGVSAFVLGGAAMLFCIKRFGSDGNCH